MEKRLKKTQVGRTLFIPLSLKTYAHQQLPALELQKSLLQKKQWKEWTEKNWLRKNEDVPS